MNSVSTKIAEGGRVVIPVEYRRELGLALLNQEPGADRKAWAQLQIGLKIDLIR